MIDQNRVMRCRNDGCMIPLVSEHRHGPKPMVRFFWCPWCQELFALVEENEFARRFAASFDFDQKEKRFTLWKSGDSPRDAEFAQEVISEVTFSPFNNG